MSSEAVGWVFRHSPYKGAAFQVHLAIADSVNDSHDNELWMFQEKLGAKARVSRQAANTALKTMMADGFVEQLDPGQGKSRPARFRFLFPDVEVIHETRKLSSTATVKPPAAKPLTVVPVAQTVVHGDRQRTQVTQESLKSFLKTCDFDDFWNLYPRRNGKRLDRGKAEAVWSRMNATERDKAMVGANHYAAACDSGLTIAKDSFRWLRDKSYEDWQTPAEAPTTKNHNQRVREEAFARRDQRNGRVASASDRDVSAVGGLPRGLLDPGAR